MSQKVHIVVGLGYGDEGKGMVTDYLVANSKKPLVIRYNGGHQAGHTVTTRDGYSHVFSHFGSGTLRNIPTYWSKYCVFSPAYVLYEYSALPVKPKIFIDKLCPVNTHYDVLFNRHLEATRGKERLGSCGVGFGATIQREEVSGIKLSIKEMFSTSILKERLAQIRGYYKSRFLKEINISFRSFNHCEEDKRFLDYIEELRQLLKEGIIYFVDENNIFTQKEWSSYIFEGAQGILLDRQFGLHPFITKSYTTSRNVLQMLARQKGGFDVDIFYVTRCYLTRHGGGPFQEFPSSYQLINTNSETNINNEFQGAFKKGFLNLDLINYALNCDSIYSKGIKKNLVMTCIDQLPSSDIFYHTHSTIKSIPYTGITANLSTEFDRSMYGLGPCSENLMY